MKYLDLKYFFCTLDVDYQEIVGPATIIQSNDFLIVIHLQELMIQSTLL